MSPANPYNPGPAQEQAFLQSVVYASLFDYPLTLAQLKEGLIGELADEQDLARWYGASSRLQRLIEVVDSYYVLRGRRDLVDVRRAREGVSRTLLAATRRPLALVAYMPFVRMAALSGSLAHLNAEDNADLDLFVITAPGRVWSVTLTTLVIARLLGWRRRLCLNYVVSERALMVSPADLFSANQILHLRPVSGAATYRRFVEANRFVARFYPNFVARSPGDRGPQPVLAGGPWWTVMKRVLERTLDWTLAPLYERSCRAIYRAHLRRRAHTWRSRDHVRLEDECLKLHTTSHRREVLDRFERALEAADAALTREEWSRVPAAR